MDKVYQFFQRRGGGGITTIEKRENGVLNAKKLSYVHCNIIINPGIIFLKGTY